MLLERRSAGLISSLHQFQRCKGRRGPVAFLKRSVAKVRFEFWSVVSGVDINREATIAPSVRLPHPNGVVIHRDAVVEDDCLIMQQVTLGQTAKPGAPHVCRGAYIGAGAKVLGAVRIGRNARVGANAVVLADVPDNCTAVGVPARIIHPRPQEPAPEQTGAGRPME